MQRTSSPGQKRITRSLASFTLIELLTVITIIAILAGLILAAAEGAMNTAARSRAKSEIQAMSTALEGYKTDNGIYPVGNTSTTAGAGSVLTGPPSGTYDLGLTTPDANYQTAAEALYQALSGQTYFEATPVAGAKVYMSFKKNQIGVPQGPFSYVQDPWGNPYGYSTGDGKNPQQSYPYNGTGFFDLWSTAGTTSSSVNPTNTWISNWTQ